MPTDDPLSPNSYTRREVLAGGIGAASLAALRPLASPAAEIKPDAAGGRPNIVLFLADDQSWFDNGCYGAKIVETPNIDRLAREGMRLTRAFTPTAMCSPSRSALYTGLYPHRNGCHRNHSKVEPGTKSLPHYLKASGYRVALAGKGHIGPPEAFPFHRLPHHARHIREFIRGKGPFCLVVASNEPHAPHSKDGPYEPGDAAVPPHQLDTPAVRRKIAAYYNDVAILDRQVGRVRKELRRQGVLDDTLLIYTSDHGSGLFAKWTCYDAGLRVPLIVRWPGKVQPGTTTGAMVSFVDVVPTLVEATGGRSPSGLDGKSFLPVLRGTARKHHEVVYGCHTTVGIHHGKPYPIRCVRTARYKYIRNLMPDATFQNCLTVPREGGKPGAMWQSCLELAETNPEAAPRVKLYTHRSADELYDVSKDPYELHNLAGDPACAAVMAEMRSKLDAWMHRQGDKGIEAERPKR